jgi:hypothetical protein
MRQEVVSSIRPSFPGLSQSQGQVTHVLLTRSPLIRPASWASSFDLHVLSTPPAFVLSQDQTLRQKNNENIKPRLKMSPPPHGGRTATTNQPNKTSGINKHGTLLSSQTTDQQPGTTPGNRVGILFRSVLAISRFPRGDLLSLSRSSPLSQIAFPSLSGVKVLREENSWICRIRRRGPQRFLAAARNSSTSVPDPVPAHKLSATAQR